MSAQTPHALQIPEILCEVFDHLQFYPKTLFAACQVNRAWAEKCLNVLWRIHWLKHLVSLPGCRRQFYADKTRHLIAKSSPIEHRLCLETVTFPRLEALSVLMDVDSWDFTRLLVPALGKFSLRINPQQHHVEDSLGQLPERCPNLHELEVFFTDAQHDFNQLEDYLKRFSKLRSIKLYGMSDRTMTNEVFLLLASLPLRELHLENSITFEVVDLAYRQLSGRLFPNVSYILLSMEARAAAALLPTLTTLRKLNLKLVSSDTIHGALQTIGTLTGLRELSITTALEFVSLCREELLAIGKLHNLRNLDITGGYMLELDDSNTDHDLVSFLSSFPELEEINIDAFYTSLIPSSATIALATTSKRLQRYRFYTTLDLDFTESGTTPVFSKLETMHCQYIYWPDVPAEG